MLNLLSAQSFIILNYQPEGRKKYYESAVVYICICRQTSYLRILVEIDKVDL